MDERQQRRERIQIIRRIEPVTHELKIVKCISISASILFGIFGLSFAILAKKKTKEMRGEFMNVIDNWRMPFLFDITTVSSSSYCPDNYSRIDIGRWPGSFEGCDCTVANSYLAWNYDVDMTLERGSCNYNQTRSGCKGVREIPEKYLNVWKNNTVICGLIYQGMSFDYVSDRYDDDVGCKQGTIQCGLNQTHSVCLPEWIGKCPISKISLSVGSSTAASTSLNRRALQAPPESLQKIVFQTEVNTSMPIVEFRTSYDQVCYDNRMMNTIEQLSGYILIDEDDRDTCEKHDSRFTKIDTYKEASFLEANGIPFQKLPIFGANLMRIDPPISLFTRETIIWHMTCRTHISTIISHENSVEDIKSYTKSLLIYTVINFIILSIFYPVLETYFICSSDETTGIGFFHMKTKHKFYLVIVGAIGWISKVFQIIYFYLVMIRAEKVMDFFTTIANLKCSDQLTNETFFSIDETIREVAYKRCKEGLYVEVFFVLVNVVVLLREIVLELVLKNSQEAVDIENRIVEMREREEAERDRLNRSQNNEMIGA